MVSKISTKWSLNDVLIEVSSFILIITSPVLVLFYWICYQFFNTSLTSTLFTAYSEGTFRFLGNRMPSFDMASILAYTVWTLFQAMLYKFLPGPLLLGQPTPSGKRLPYRINGLLAWGVTLVSMFLVHFSGLVRLTFIAEHWEGLVWAVNIYSLALLITFHLKAYHWPDSPEDNVSAGKFNQRV
jgi:7-dehydrocholesterol reductase